MLRRLKAKIPIWTLHCIYMYNNIIQTYIDCFITACGYALDIYINKFRSLQKKTSHQNNKSGVYDFKVSCIVLIKQFRWFSVHQRRDYFTAIPMHRCVTATAPGYLSERCEFIHGSDVITKSQTNEESVEPKPMFRQSIDYQRPRNWNDLPITVRWARNI